MSTSGLIMMLSAWSVISYYTIKFFIKVLRTPPKPEPDSYSENDDVKR
jgi:hypothetical protein